MNETLCYTLMGPILCPMTPTTDNNARDERSVLRPNMATFLINYKRFQALYDYKLRCLAQLYMKLSIRDIENAKVKLTRCFAADIQSWCASMRLKLNASKTELIWFSNLAKEKQPNFTVKIDDNCIIEPSDVVRDLGVFLDNILSMTHHISSVTKSCFFHLRRLRQIKKLPQ